MVRLSQIDTRTRILTRFATRITRTEIWLIIINIRQTTETWFGIYVYSYKVLLFSSRKDAHARMLSARYICSLGSPETNLNLLLPRLMEIHNTKSIDWVILYQNGTLNGEGEVVSKMPWQHLKLPIS